MTTTPANAVATPAPADQEVRRSWIDENTGRPVRMLSRKGGSLSYFRYPRHLPGNLMLAYIDEQFSILDPASGEHQRVTGVPGHYLKLHKLTNSLFTIDKKRRVYVSHLPADAGRLIGQVPPEIPGHVNDITCDGRFVILTDNHDNAQDKHPAPTTKDVATFWHYIARPRRGALRAYDLQNNTLTTLFESEGFCPFHVDTSPTDPGLVRFAVDQWEGLNQRVFAVRVDGTGLRKIRPQESGELITHEFWWADGRQVGFTYQDRRKEATMRELPWCEYSPTPTQLGIADESGREVYLSDPVNHYHTHLYISHHGKLLSGSGTDGHSFVYAATFSMNDTRINYVPLATVHTPYIPFRGQSVNCDFSADGRWLLYSDTIDGKLQLCAVEVDL